MIIIKIHQSHTHMHTMSYIHTKMHIEILNLFLFLREVEKLKYKIY